MPSHLDLNTAVVLITGGTGGIGRALAQRYAASGSKVFVTSRKPAPNPSTVQHQKGSITTIQSDLSSAKQRQALYKTAQKEFPDLNILINNAGIARPVPLAEDGPDTSWDERQAEIDTVLSGPVHLTSLLLPLMLANGKPGVVINVTSGVAFFPNPAAPLYSACKHAMRAHTTLLRHSLRKTKTGVIDLCPPMLETGLAGSKGGASLEEFIDGVWPKIQEGQETITFGQLVMPQVDSLRGLQEELFAMLKPHVEGLTAYE